MSVDARAGSHITQLIELVDWSKTPLGPRNLWSETLQTSVNICLHAPFPTLVIWGSGMIQLYNDAYGRVIGLKHPAALGQSAKETWKELWPEIGEMFEAILRDGKSFQRENKPFTVYKSGIQEVAFFTTSLSPIVDSTNRVQGIFATVVETTGIISTEAMANELEKVVHERTHSLEKTNRALKRSEEQYHRVIAEVQDYAIILLDPDGIILTWNKGAEKIKRYTESEILGKHFSIFYLPEDQQQRLPQQLMAEAERNGRAVHEGWRRRKDGTRFWGSITITALHNSRNEIIGFSKVTRDLTDKKNADDRMLEYTRQLELQNKELEQFAYVASHDLQEPLRKIQTFSGIIQRNIKDENAVTEYLRKIDVASLRLSQLVKSLLDYSRLSAVSLYEETVDLNLTLANVKNDFELLIEETKTQIVSAPLPVIKGHTIQLSQLFANLIGNAIKFRKEIPQIKISYRTVARAEVKNDPGNLTKDQYAEISFRDNGIGFDQKYESKIFTIFQRLNARHEFEGTGIGLALCKKIMLHHEGHITCESKPGEGTTFYTYFPRAIVRESM